LGSVGMTNRLVSLLGLAIVASTAFSPVATLGAETNCSVIGGTFQFQRYFPKSDEVEIIGRMTLSGTVAQSYRGSDGEYNQYFITKYDDPNERYWSLIPYAKANGIVIFPDLTELKALGRPVIDAINYGPKIDPETEEFFLQGNRVFDEGTGNCSPRALNALKRGFATDFLRG